MTPSRAGSAGEGWTKADLSKVRVGHLLSHTSGLGSYFNDTWERSARQLYRKVGDWKPLVAEETLAFEPGTRWSYSNTGMLLAGAVLEKASGRDYFDLVRQELYGPAGMKDTDCYDIDLVVKDLAIGYSQRAHARPARGGAPTPSSTSSVVDRPGAGTPPPPTCWPSPKPCARAAREAGDAGAALEPEAGVPRYGYGFGLEDGPPAAPPATAAGFSGISSNLDIFRDTGFVAVVLSNQDGGSEPVTQRIRELVARVR